MSLPSFSTIDGVKWLNFSRGIVPPVTPVPDLNQAELVTMDGSDHVQNIGPYRFNYYTMSWDLIEYSDYVLLLDWYITTCNGKANSFLYYTPYGTVATVKFTEFGSFTEVSSTCLSGSIKLKEKILR